MELPSHIRDLLKPEAYPERAASVELIQTHISYLFFTPEYVYKIKKPVDFGFLDFTSLDKRLFFCKEEVRLNGRLAPGVYMGVAQITADEGGARIGGSGRVVDYAVKMRRLPLDAMLEALVRKDRATEETVKKAARAIAAFHKSAERGARIAAFGSIEVIDKNTEENFSQTGDFIGNTISRRLFSKIKNYTRDFIRANKGLFLKRAEGGFIRDCHGDIHLENVFITDGIKIIDCIEFNERFRFSDVVSDIAFLSMDLDFHNRNDLSRALDKAYFSTTGDREGRRLLDFYKCYRAYIRGKVEGFKLKEEEVPDKDKKTALVSALRHYHLAGLYAGGGFRPMVILVCGLSGTGKTTLAAALSEALCAPVLSTDAVRKELAGIKPAKHVFEAFKKGIYSDEFTEKTYEALIEKGVRYIKDGRSVILDATFSKGKFIKAAGYAARKAGAAEGLFHIVECRAPDKTIKERLLKRPGEEAPEGAPVSDMRWELYKEQKKVFEKIEAPRTVANMDKPPEQNAIRILRKILS